MKEEKQFNKLESFKYPFQLDQRDAN